MRTIALTLTTIVLAVSGRIGAAAVLESAWSARDFELTLDPDSDEWREAPRVSVDHDYLGKPIAGPPTEIRSRWTNQHLYLLYINPYDELNLKPDPTPAVETPRLWNWDVAEAFIGSDADRITRYKEFQVSPQGEWVDLDIDRDDPKGQAGMQWNSGYTVKARVDAGARIWYGAMRIPFAAIDSRPPQKGRELRIGLYRIAGVDPNKRFYAWQPTGATSFHVPKAFGTLRLAGPAPEPQLALARANGREFERAAQAAHQVLRAWLAHADAQTLLLPDRPGNDRSTWIYTPHNSGADLYPYLILTAHLTDPDLYRGRMMEMLRNEVQYTTVQRSIPGDLNFATRQVGKASFFGAGEYAKDGLIAVTEYLGRTPWFYRMVDMMADAMADAPVASRFGALPAADAETNGDYLQALVRIAAMTGDERFLAWARRIGDAYIEEVLPGSGGVPGHTWDFQKHAGARRLRLRDHGNETMVGLVMLFTLEHQLSSPRAQTYRPVIQRMLDRVLASANADGLLYNEVNVDTLEPIDRVLSDNWGYVYGAVYSYYLVTGETRYRDAVRQVLRALPKYRKHVWEPRADPALPLGSFDGYADAIESAIYLASREPVPEAFDWIDSEMEVMLGMQRRDGHIEDWYGEGNFNRTALLYAYMKSQGVRPERWEPGVRVGAARDGERLLLHLDMPAARRLQFDFARHRRVLNFARNYVRLNEFPEWFTVDENHLYRLRPAAAEGAGRTWLGSELIAGVDIAPGEWILEPAGKPPYAR